MNNSKTGNYSVSPLRGLLCSEEAPGYQHVAPPELVVYTVRMAARVIFGLVLINRRGTQRETQRYAEVIE
jgi:hypothetical protein